jgi:SAM-dependent methyltransferase
MVGVVMRYQDGRQGQTLTLKHFEYRASIAGIDNNRCSTFAQQPDVVILESWNPDDVKHCMIVEDRLKMSIPGIDDWLGTAQGRYVMAWEQTKVDALVADLFGYNALQLGLPQHELLVQNRIPLRQIVGESGAVNVRCDLRELPFAAGSVDLVVMPHVLEFHSDPHQILREVERVLIPEGQLVITGFNPISLWGLRRRMPNCPHEFPMNGDYISVLRLKDWLQLLSFDVDRGNFGCYAPPCAQDGWIKRWRFVEAAGNRWWGFAGGVYLLRAVKRVRGMRLIMPRWKQKAMPAKALTAITQKEFEDRVR